MKIYYALLLTQQQKDQKRIAQLLQSICSVRHFNSSVSITLFLITSQPESEFEKTIKHTYQIEIIRIDHYADLINSFCDGMGSVFDFYPVLHKYIALNTLFFEDCSHILYLDCDTFIYSDPQKLCEELGIHQFAAREEPYSQSSWLGYRPEIINQDIVNQKLISNSVIHPFNTGIVLWQAEALKAVYANIQIFFDFLVRLVKGMSLPSRDVSGAEAFNDLIQTLQNGAASSQLKSIPYPVKNYWLVEEVALWATLSHLGFSQKIFSPHQVMQGCEEIYFSHKNNAPILSHYFSENTQLFFSSQNSILQTTLAGQSKPSVKSR